MFHNAFWVTLQYVLINIILQTIIALGLALLMHNVAKSTFIRGTLLMPYLMANVIAALLWFWLLDYQIGIVNYFIDAIGLPKVAFFGSETWAIPTQALINTWRHMGYTALLIFAGLQSIPSTVYEAAAIDGAKPFQTLTRVTLPLLRPVLALVLVQRRAGVSEDLVELGVAVTHTLRGAGVETVQRVVRVTRRGGVGLHVEVEVQGAEVLEPGGALLLERLDLDADLCPVGDERLSHRLDVRATVGGPLDAGLEAVGGTWPKRCALCAPKRPP